jgi:hypothetical protein
MIARYTYLLRVTAFLSAYVNLVRLHDYLTNFSDPNFPSIIWFEHPRGCILEVDSSEDLAVLASHELSIFKAVLIPCRAKRGNYLELYELGNQVDSARKLLEHSLKNTTAAEILQWPTWDTDPEPLPGSEDRASYLYRPLWPGPPDANQALATLKLTERRRHHRAFYYADTGRFMTQAEANQVTLDDPEEQRLFQSPADAWEDRLELTTQGALELSLQERAKPPSREPSPEWPVTGGTYTFPPGDSTAAWVGTASMHTSSASSSPSGSSRGRWKKLPCEDRRANPYPHPQNPNSRGASRP